MKKLVFPLLFRCLLSFLMAFCLWQCANPIAPTGGPRDETPPVVDVTKSSVNNQTNYRPKTIELTFNEWVKLKDANQQIIISPPLQGFSTRLKGKTVILDLGDKDTLRSNVTYVIQFGEAVQDLTENNPAEDLRYVFSTGPYIDSLQISGQVVDAYTAEPVEGALVLLYDNLADSVFRKERPFYFGRTDKQGMFLVSNLKAGNYRLAALKDADANYLYSQPTEAIAFLADPINISADSIPALSLRLFQEALPLKLNDTDSSRFGVLKLLFNSPIAGRVQQQSSASYWQQETADSLLIWHQEIAPWTLYLSSDTLFYDTIPVPAAPRDRADKKLGSLVVALATGTPPQIYPRKPLRLFFSRPVSQLDTSRMALLLDTLTDKVSYQSQLDSLSPRQAILTHPWRENSNYQLLFYPGAITDYWGVQNTDTLTAEWRVAELKRFGNLKLTFINAPSDAHYFVKLLRKDKAPDATFSLTGETTYEKQFNGLSPGDYQLEIIEDINTNGRWDSGNYDAQRQPERVLIRPLESLRANWDLEASVDLNSFFEK